MTSGDSERRNKGKDKKKNRKKHPYRKGGRFRSTEISESKGKKEK
ncbi:MAG: hypothetical protein ABIB79_02230 [archaeon]